MGLDAERQAMTLARSGEEVLGLAYANASLRRELLHDEIHSRDDRKDVQLAVFGIAAHVPNRQSVTRRDVIKVQDVLRQVRCLELSLELDLNSEGESVRVIFLVLFEVADGNGDRLRELL